MGAWADWAGEEARRIRAGGRWRSVREVDGPGPAVVLGGAAGLAGTVVSFASNDYLGLTRHPAVVAAAAHAVERWGAGAGSARLVAGARPLHRELESALAAWKGTEAAVLFATGYAANLGVLQALGGPGVTVVSDRLNHASIVDGCRLSRADVVVTPHADVAAVERAVAAAPGRALVVTESVFSMDGDLAPLDDMVTLCARHGALLVVDDAHAVLGPDVSPGDAVVLRVATLSKALGSLGGFVAGPQSLCDLLVNRARTFVFTTASTPADTAAALAALEITRSPAGDALRARLRAHVERLRPGHPSPIVPVVVGGEEAALAASAALLDLGLLVPAIRPPTVPPGTSRLRISLTAAHTTEQVDRLAAGLASLGLGGPEFSGQPSPPSGRPRRENGPDRPERLVLVLGTETGVGKTWVTAALAGAVRASGLVVAARKPVQSYGPGVGPTPGTDPVPARGAAEARPAAGGGPTDADVLAAATGQSATHVCPRHRWYPVAMAPPLAAESLGRAPFALADLLDEFRWPPGAQLGLVEGVGGPRSPLATDADNVALALALSPDSVVLVADAGLGAINAVLLAAAALPVSPIVFLNRYVPDDPVHAANAEWLEKRAGLTVVTSIDDLAKAVFE